MIISLTTPSQQFKMDQLVCQEMLQLLKCFEEEHNQRKHTFTRNSKERNIESTLEGFILGERNLSRMPQMTIHDQSQIKRNTLNRQTQSSLFDDVKLPNGDSNYPYLPDVVNKIKKLRSDMQRNNASKLSKMKSSGVVRKPSHLINEYNKKIVSPNHSSENAKNARLNKSKHLQTVLASLERMGDFWDDSIQADLSSNDDKYPVITTSDSKLNKSKHLQAVLASLERMEDLWDDRIQTDLSSEDDKYPVVTTSDSALPDDTSFSTESVFSPISVADLKEEVNIKSKRFLNLRKSATIYTSVNDSDMQNNDDEIPDYIANHFASQRKKEFLSEDMWKAGVANCVKKEEPPTTSEFTTKGRTVKLVAGHNLDTKARNIRVSICSKRISLNGDSTEGKFDRDFVKKNPDEENGPSISTKNVDSIDNFESIRRSLDEIGITKNSREQTESVSVTPKSSDLNSAHFCELEVNLSLFPQSMLTKESELNKKVNCNVTKSTIISEKEGYNERAKPSLSSNLESDISTTKPRKIKFPTYTDSNISSNEHAEIGSALKPQSIMMYGLEDNDETINETLNEKGAAQNLVQHEPNKVITLSSSFSIPEEPDIDTSFFLSLSSESEQESSKALNKNPIKIPKSTNMKSVTTDINEKCRTQNILKEPPKIVHTMLNSIFGGFSNLTTTNVPPEVEVILSLGPHLTSIKMPSVSKYLSKITQNVSTNAEDYLEQYLMESYKTMIEDLSQQRPQQNSHLINVLEKVILFLQQHKELCILHHGRGTVLMRRDEYYGKLEALLAKGSADGVYREIFNRKAVEEIQEMSFKLYQNFHNALLENILFAINRGERGFYLYKIRNILNMCNKSKTSLPFLYGELMLQSHNGGEILRPLHNGLNWCNRGLLRVIECVLSNFLKHPNVYLLECNVKDVTQVASDIRSTDVLEGFSFIKIGIEDMYTSVNISEIIHAFSRVVECKDFKTSCSIDSDLLIRILESCLYSMMIFEHRGKVYRQVKGILVGSPASLLLVTILLDYQLQLHDKEIFQNCLVLKKFKHEDEFLFYMHESRVEALIRNLEKYTHLKFWIDREDPLDGSQTFLDISIQRDTKRFHTKIRRRSNTKTLIGSGGKHDVSYIPQDWRRDIIQGHLRMILDRVSNRYLLEELQHLEKELFCDNIYPKVVKELIRYFINMYEQSKSNVDNPIYNLGDIAVRIRILTEYMKSLKL